MLHVFIINSFAGSGIDTALFRKKIEQRTDINFLILNAEYQGHEGILAERICDLFPDERIRFYACGGSGTFRNMMNGIEDFDRVELAEYACGLTNDFLNVFNKREAFADLDKLVDGTCMPLDYIVSNRGKAHNTISAGIDVVVIKGTDFLTQNPFFHGRQVYFVMEFFGVFLGKSVAMDVTLDGEDYSGSYYQVIIANGTRLGGLGKLLRHNSPEDGKLQVILLPKKNIFFKVRSFLALLWNQEEFIREHCIIKECSHIEMSRTDKKVMPWNYDGELVIGGGVKIDVEEKGMHYVVPDGIKLAGEERGERG